MNRKIFFRNRELSVFDSVYAPREDSFLLAQSVEVMKGASVLDLGCGSGIQGINALALGAAKVLFADLNKNALENALLNAEKLGFAEKATARESDLFSKINEKFDCIIFNPPYVETEKITEGERDVAGGRNGREVLDRFLAEFPRHLAEGGACFFLQSDLNGVKETESALEKAGLSFSVIARKRIFFEELLVFRCLQRKHF
ncbi:MAG: HemK2/MTQ2 family protein methyltransferase [Candidatus Diapherotrites archaeon]